MFIFVRKVFVIRDANPRLTARWHDVYIRKLFSHFRKMSYLCSCEYYIILNPFKCAPKADLKNVRRAVGVDRPRTAPCGSLKGWMCSVRSCAFYCDYLKENPEIRESLLSLPLRTMYFQFLFLGICCRVLYLTINSAEPLGCKSPRAVLYNKLRNKWCALFAAALFFMSLCEQCTSSAFRRRHAARPTAGGSRRAISRFVSVFIRRISK